MKPLGRLFLGFMLVLAFLQLYVIYSVQPQSCPVSKPSADLIFRDFPGGGGTVQSTCDAYGNCHSLDGQLICPEGQTCTVLDANGNYRVKTQSYTWIEPTGEFQSLPFPCPAERKCS